MNDITTEFYLAVIGAVQSIRKYRKQLSKCGGDFYTKNKAEVFCNSYPITLNYAQHSYLIYKEHFIWSFAYVIKKLEKENTFIFPSRIDNLRYTFTQINNTYPILYKYKAFAIFIEYNEKNKINYLTFIYLPTKTAIRFKFPGNKKLIEIFYKDFKKILYIDDYFSEPAYIDDMPVEDQIKHIDSKLILTNEDIDIEFKTILDEFNITLFEDSSSFFLHITTLGE